MINHTPGPWSYIIGVNGVIIDAPNQPLGKRDIARTVAMPGAIENARLIAAAPDLLAVCNPDLLLAAADRLRCIGATSFALALRGKATIELAAIAKAEGREP